MYVLLSELIHVLLQWNSLYCKYLQESCFEQKTEFHSPGKKRVQSSESLNEAAEICQACSRFVPVHQCAGIVTRD